MIVHCCFCLWVCVIWIFAGFVGFWFCCFVVLGFLIVFVGTDAGALFDLFSFCLWFWYLILFVFVFGYFVYLGLVW